ncbi:glycosyltransferase [Cyanobium sp. ATX 6F1]|uniref:glycosyltransferase n=1 Tax=Cyanobium sp. ATX 6F1 TaxID=2823702 RepID=UPI0020CEB758|nr:glycosyltransferase [Cyanobium sp. ATX 6F1]MCP9915753.1 glycosyltransferase [Cyanobium sp. ATX 6F1]
MDPSTKPLISVVIGSRNEGSQLQSTLEQLMALTPPTGGLECSLLDDGSNDSSSAFLDAGPWLELRQQGIIRLRRLNHSLGVSRGRRFASVGCRGEVLVFIDAHLDFPQSDLWIQMERHFTDPGCHLLSIDCYDSRNGNTTAGSVYTSRRLCHQQPAWMPIQSDPLVNWVVPFVNGGFFAIRRSVYEQLGGFPDFLQGWGHEDRFLSMLAGLAGFECRLDQSLQVGHRYKDVFEDPGNGDPPTSCSDPLPADGLVLNAAPFVPAADGDPPPPMLMNSLRCSYLLYDGERFQQSLEQLSFDYGAELGTRALALLQQEQPQLDALLAQAGLNPSQRDQRLEAFCQKFRPMLPMLDEALLHASTAMGDSQQALEVIQQLPREIASLHQPDADHYRTARLYREASRHYELGHFPSVAALLLELLSIEPNHLPSICMLAIGLRRLNRPEGARHWLTHGVNLVDQHRATTGPGPLGAWHPACQQPYLRHLYWPGADRFCWQGLAELSEEAGQWAEAVRWLSRVLEQTPDDEEIHGRLQRCLLSRPKKT